MAITDVVQGSFDAAGADEGGFAGAVGAHFAGDAFDHVANGKEGWDSGGDYLTSGLIGAGTGLAMSGVGLIGSKFLPAGQRTLASGYAERYPRMTALLEQARQFGASSLGAVAPAGRAAGQRVTMTLAQIQELVASGMGPLPETALAGNGSEVALASLARDTRIRVTLSALEDLNQPMLSVGHDFFDGPAFGIDELEIADQLGYGNAGYDERDMSIHGESAEVTAMNQRDARAAGLSKEGGAVDEHHVMPQEVRRKKCFPERGVDVDDYVVDIPRSEHEAQHGAATTSLHDESKMTSSGSIGMRR